MNEQKIKDVIIDAIACKGLFPGCVAQFFDGMRYYSFSEGSYEFIDKESPTRKIERDASYDIASIGKIMVYTVFLKLVAEGRVSLETPVSSITPFKKQGDIQQMTFRQLLSCQADFLLTPELEVEPHLKDEKGNFLFFAEAELRGKLGTMFRYGNFAAFVIGVAIEVLTGLKLEKALQRFVFDPLKMGNTGYDVQNCLERVVPTQVIGLGNKPKFYWQRGVPQDPMTQLFNLDSNERVGISGIFSNIADMTTFARFLATGLTPHDQELIPFMLWKDMLSDQLRGKQFADGKSHSYGLGIDRLGMGYVSCEKFGEVFGLKGVGMAGSSGPFIFACPDWSYQNMRSRPIGGVILCNTWQERGEETSVFKERCRSFRRAMVSTFLEEVIDG